MPTKVRLTYFKRSGKYYSDGEYETEQTMFYELVKEIRELQINGKLPGLVEGAREFTVYLEPTEPWGVPHIFP